MDAQTIAEPSSDRDKMEHQIETVVAKIAEVEDEIRHAASKYEAASSDRDKDYWATKEQQLRTKEQQLRTKEEQLRTKEQQLRTKEEQLRSEKREKERTKVEPASVSKSDVLECCEKFVNHNVPRSLCSKQDFEMQLQSSTKPVFCLHQQPCLLWHGVNSDLVPVDARLESKVRTQHITVLLAPSGSGKTRQLIELASRRFCLFFTGRRQASAGGGSNDVQAACSWLERMYPLTNVEPLAVTCCARALLLARLYIFKSAKQLKPDLTPAEWVFYQLEGPAVRDKFMELTSTVLQMIQSPDRMGLCCSSISNALDEVAKSEAWDGFTVLDEAQIVDGYMPNRFSFTTSHGIYRSVLNSLVSELSGCEMAKSLYVSGTGIGMLKVREGFESRLVKPGSNVGEVYKLQGFEGVEDITTYLLEFIDVTPLNMAEIALAYTGRRRWLVTALERYMVQPHAPEKHTDFFLSFCHDLCTKPGAALSLRRSLYDEATEFFERHPGLREFVQHILYCRYTGGTEMPVVVPPSDTAIYLLECGLGYVKEDLDNSLLEVPVFGNMGERPRFNTAYYSKDMLAKKVVFAEEMVATAMMAAMPNTCKTSQFACQAQGPTSLGLSYEFFSLESIAMAFENKQPALVLGFSDAPPVYLDTYELMRPRIASKFVRDLSDTYTIGHWLDDVEARSAFPVCVCTGSQINFGPDAIFLQRSPMTGKVLCYFLQHKTGIHVGTHVALGTIDVTKFYANGVGMTSKVEEGLKKLQEWCKDGYVKLLVTTQLHGTSNSHMTQEGGLVTQRRSLRRKLEQPTQAPLVGIISKSNAVAFIDRGTLSVIEQVKGEAMQKRRKRT